MSLDQPLELALIGTGNRAQRIYRPLFESLRPWVRLCAVCDPVREHADAFAAQMDVPAFYSLQELVHVRPMEAALVVTPIESHHAISCYLSQHGIHNLVETSMCRLLAQGQEMVDTAQRNNVVFRIAENFFRYPFDRIATKIVQTGLLGPVKRLTCFHDHTGYHNNSRWIKLYAAHPTAAQAITHTMPVAAHYEAPHRFHDDERYRAFFFFFPDDRLVADMAGNIKSMLGRYPRPGYTELDGARGTIVRQALRPGREQAEVRFCSDYALQNGAVADLIYPIVHVIEDDWWHSSYCELPDGRVEYHNPFSYRPTPGVTPVPGYPSAAVMDHIVDFARAVRDGAPSEYLPEDALMALMMEAATRESALQDGRRISLPLDGELETEHLTRRTLAETYGADPLDIEATLALSFPRP